MENSFKIWDNLEERMLTHNDILTRVGTFITVADVLSLMNCDRFDFLAYTNLNDKYNNKIYDRDIIKCDYLSSLAVVKFNKRKAKWIIKCDYFSADLTKWDCEHYFEVVGNYKEDPSVL